MIKSKELLAFRFGLTWDVKLSQNEIEELIGVHPGIEEKGGTGIAMMQPIQEPVDEGGLAGANFTGERDETFACLNPVHQASQRFLDLLGQIEEAGIGIYVERIFFQSIEALCTYS